MTPTVPEILRGNFAVLAHLATQDTGGDFKSAQLMTVALLNLLCGQEVERAGAVLGAENEAMEDLFAAAGHEIGTVTGDPDTRNVLLRRELICLHERAEASGDRATERKVLTLYCLITEGRRLEFPPLP